MKTVKCKNTYIVEGKEVECNRILAVLTDLQVDILKVDPEGGPIFRCPKCHPDQRWIKITSVEGKTVFESLSGHQDFKEDLKCDELIICKQVG
jgi:hypothetical protein